MKKDGFLPKTCLNILKTDKMGHIIRYSQKSTKDLDGIYDYIKYELSNPKAAETTINSIHSKIDSIVDFLEDGSKVMFINNIDSGYRRIRYKNYIVFYKINCNGEVFVCRILYSGRNYMNLLF